MVVEGVEVYAGRVGYNNYCDGVEKGRLHHLPGLDHLILRKSEIMIRGWSTPQWSKLVGNCIFAEALGAYLEIFKQTYQKRPEAKVSLRGHLTTMSK